MIRKTLGIAFAIAVVLLGGMFVATSQPHHQETVQIQAAAALQPANLLPTVSRAGNLALDNNPAAMIGPAVPHPAGSTVIVPVYNVFVSHNTTSSVENTSVVFPAGHFSRITVTFFDQYISNPFDTSFIVSVDNVQMLAGNTLELENTSVTQNVTEYSSILSGNATVFTTCPQFNPGYSSALSVWFTFYNGTPASQPNVVLPAFTNINFPTPQNAFPNNVPLPFNVSRSVNVTFPDNVTSASLNLYIQQNGNDEFWYTLQPPFREFRVFINNTLVGTVQPYPNVQTGGGDLFLWQPILGIGAELYPPHVINLNPYLSLLKGKKEITVQVVNDENLWIRAAANFMLTTTQGQTTSGHSHSAFSFHDSYTQTPATNFTTKSIPSSAAYLNDTQYVNETLVSSGYAMHGKTSTFSSSVQRVSFFANSSEFDPNFNILQNTSFGQAFVYTQSFYLREYINTTTSTSVGMNLGFYHRMLSSTQTSVDRYYQINGTALEYVVLNPFSVVVGFNVTQIKMVDMHSTTTVLEGNHYARSVRFNNTFEKVSGNGIFAAELNSNNVITVLTYNHATTAKTVFSVAGSSGNGVSFYMLKEKAVNNSLVNRNGTLVYRHVEEHHGGGR